MTTDTELKDQLSEPIEDDSKATTNDNSISEVYTLKIEKENEQYRLLILLCLFSLVLFICFLFYFLYLYCPSLEIILSNNNLIVFVILLSVICFPFLLFFYSINKKINISKQLIEDYTHKYSVTENVSLLLKIPDNKETTLNQFLKDLSETEQTALQKRLITELLDVMFNNPSKRLYDDIFTDTMNSEESKNTKDNTINTNESSGEEKKGNSTNDNNENS